MKPSDANLASASAATSITIDGYAFAPEDHPAFPGGPLAPPHPALRRIGYAMIGTWIGATATLANALVTVNLPSLAGEHGLYLVQLSWLPAIFVAFNASTNLLLVKARAQFGVATIMTPLFLLYAVAAALQFFVQGFAAAVIVRAISGVATAGMTTYGMYYWLQVMPPKARPLALIIGLGLTQLGSPIARMLPVDLLSAGAWQGLHCVELALALITLALTLLLPLPPSVRVKQFERLDLLTVALVLPAMILLCGVLSLGRLSWWTDTPALGVWLAVSIPLFVVAMSVELLRANPLLKLDWIGSAEIARFAAVALMMRLALAEQTYGSVGFLTSGGLDNDQLRVLFGIVLVGMTLGIVAGALTVSAKAVPFQVIVAALAVSAGAWLDSGSSEITRPQQLYLSQALIGFGTCLFIGPTLAHGILQVMKRGPEFLVSLVVLFSITQNVGGLIGSAALGSYQVIESRANATLIADGVIGGDPQVEQRITGGAAALSGAVVDPQARAIQSRAGLGGALGTASNVLGYVSVFRLVALFTLAIALYVLYSVVASRAVRPRKLEVT